jgi:hypothetical protein
MSDLACSMGAYKLLEVLELGLRAAGPFGAVSFSENLKNDSWVKL